MSGRGGLATRGYPTSSLTHAQQVGIATAVVDAHLTAQAAPVATGRYKHRVTAESSATLASNRRRASMLDHVGRHDSLVEHEDVGVLRFHRHVQPVVVVLAKRLHAGEGLDAAAASRSEHRFVDAEVV